MKLEERSEKVNKEVNLRLMCFTPLKNRQLYFVEILEKSFNLPKNWNGNTASSFFPSVGSLRLPAGGETGFHLIPDYH